MESGGKRNQKEKGNLKPENALEYEREVNFKEKMGKEMER